MSRLKQMVGMRCGRLVVLERVTPSNGRTRWRCMCDCGSTITSNAYDLRSGRSRSCGCLHRDRTLVNITGLRFGRLLVISAAGKRGRAATWNCVCDCGTKVVVVGDILRRGRTRSCGCLHREVAAALGRQRRTHGHTCGGRVTGEYEAWRGMIRRCTRATCNAYGNYGARGISVCEHWRGSFEAFFADMGPKPSREHSIDRINNDGHYEPGNCRWATWKEQANNRRKPRWAIARPILREAI